MLKSLIKSNCVRDCLTNRILSNFIVILTKERISQKRAHSNSLNPLEIERKFWFDFDIESKLISIGAKKIEKNFGKIIRDQYYDNTENYFLVLNDYLLRYRVENNTGKWQLKYPSQPIDRSRDIENYFEAENSQDISQLVLDLAKKRAFFQNKMHMSHLETVESLVSALDLECFVKINSKRKSYRFEMMKIDLDETDFGYKLGEIELILDHGASQETKEESFKKISGLTNQLGITKHDKIPGKISAYLFQFNKKLFELLRANGIIEDTVAQNLKNLIKKF